MKYALDFFGILSLLDEIPFSLPKSRETKNVGFFNGFHLAENGPHGSSNGKVPRYAKT